MRSTPFVAALLAAAVLNPVPAQSAPAACTYSYETAAGAYAHCTGVHPGIPLYVAVPGEGTRTCGAGFLFTDAKRDRYFAVSARCVYDPICLEEELVHVEVPQLPPPLDGVPRLVEQLVCIAVPSGKEGVFSRNAPVVTDTNGRRIGVVAYAVDKAEVAFGLVKLDKSVAATGEVPLVGGPTRINSDRMSVGGAQTWVFSRNDYGTVAGVPQLNARRGAAPLGWDTRADFLVHSPQGGAYMNTHGVVLDERGGALGFIDGDFLTAYSYVTQLEDGVARAAKVAKINLTLVTAPFRR